MTASGNGNRRCSQSQDHHDHPDGHHRRMLLGGRSTHQGHELLEPTVVLE
jgi:hypothetical protein